MKKIISLVMVFCMLCGLIVVSAEETLNANVVLKFNNPGNIYFTGDKETLVATYFNNSDSFIDLDISFLATGRKYLNTWSYKTNVSLLAHSSIKENISIDFAEDVGVYDIYDLVITLTDGLRTKTVTTEFSYANRGVKNDKFGINTHFAWQDYEPYLEKSMSILKNSGISIVRDTVSDWSVYEKEKGVYEMPDEYKNMMNTILENDIEILHILAYGNTLYTEDRVMIPVEAEEVTGFVNYARELVEETKGKIKYFEIWNEPNQSGFNVADDDGTGYGNLVKAVYPVITTANPEAYVLGYASSGLNNSIDKTAKTGAYNYMDAASFHPYPEYDSTGKLEWATGDMLPEERTISFLNRFRERAKRNNLWITEQGWSSGDNVNTEGQQAAYLVRAYTLMMADGNVEKYFWYELIRPAARGDSHAGKYGMLNGRGQALPLSARPVFMSMTNMNSKLANTEFDTYSVTDNVYKCDFEKINGENLSVIWLKTKDETASKNASFDFECKRLLKTDLYGNEEVLTSETGIYSIQAGCDPAYYEPLADETEKFEYEYNTKTGICTIKGYIDSREENIPVNMMLYRPEKSFKDLTTENETETLSYFNQCLTSYKGVYEFEFSPKDGEGVYLLNIASEDGETFETYIDLRSKLTCSATVKDKAIDDIAVGEKFTVSVNVTGENKVYKVYNVYVALFNDNRLVNVLSKTGEVMDNELTKTTEIEMVAESEFDEIRAFAWESNMKPIANSVSIPKTK